MEKVVQADKIVVEDLEVNHNIVGILDLDKDTEETKIPMELEVLGL